MKVCEHCGTMDFAEPAKTCRVHRCPMCPKCATFQEHELQPTCPNGDETGVTGELYYPDE